MNIMNTAFIKAYQDLYESFTAKYKHSPEEETEWSVEQDKEFQKAYRKLLNEYGRTPLDERLDKMSIQKQTEILSILKAIEITEHIPEINETLLDLYEDDAEFVEIGLENDEMVIRVVKADGTAVSGPTSDSVHVNTPDWKPNRRRKKTDEVSIVMNGGTAPIIKAETDSEQRYTLSPWYVPDSLDAHGEWTDKDEVQRAFWKYLAQDSRDIRLQHDIDIVAGQWVEGCTWPYEFTTTLKHPEGDVEYTFPAGTPFLGIIWDEWAWNLIKAGQIRGLSIGGTSERYEADLVIDDTDYDPMGKVYFEDKSIKKASFKQGDFVRWGSGTGKAQGRITRIVSSGKINVPDSSFSIEGTEDDPALLIRIYQKGKDGWASTDTLVGHKASTVNPIESLDKAESFTPPKGVQEEAQMAQEWIKDGLAGSNFTSVGSRRAGQLANGSPVSLDTIRRMNSFLARHAVDSKAEGFNYGEEGFPSPGRVSWSAWGGEPAVSWVREVLDGIEE